jgi:uncharacterized membrane protein YbjE (DUF340 family)
MLYLIVSFILGGIFGRVFYKQKNIPLLNKRLTYMVILILLFSMGLSTGSNETILKNLPTLGMDSLVLTIFATLGSILFLYPVYHKYFKEK